MPRNRRTSVSPHSHPAIREIGRRLFEVGGLSQTEVAQKTGIDNGKLTHIFDGAQRILFEDMVRLGWVAGMSPNELAVAAGLSQLVPATPAPSSSSPTERELAVLLKVAVGQMDGSMVEALVQRAEAVEAARLHEANGKS